MTNSTSYRSYQMRINSSQERLDNILYKSNFQERMTTALKIKGPRFFIHSLVWIALYFLPSWLFLKSNAGPEAFLTDAGDTNHLIVFALLIGFVYLDHYYMVPFLYLQKKFILYFSFITVCICSLLLLQQLAAPEASNILQTEAPHTFLLKLHYIVIVFIVSVPLSIAIHQKIRLAGNEKEISRMKTSLLNAQINPHFLFNSLNWIYLLALEKSTETPNAIVQLSGLMRYLMKDVNADVVDLKKELGYIKNYVLLQKGKLGHTISLTCTVPVYTGTLTIAPLLLMSFIENAFKYGVNPEEDSAINIDISLTGNKLSLQIINNKVSSMYNAKNTGIGIDNAKKRLQLLYPSLHQLEILDDYKIYSVKLSMFLQ